LLLHDVFVILFKDSIFEQKIIFRLFKRLQDESFIVGEEEKAARPTTSCEEVVDTVEIVSGRKGIKHEFVLNT
jgi:hypothetical protein